MLRVELQLDLRRSHGRRGAWQRGHRAAVNSVGRGRLLELLAFPAGMNARRDDLGQRATGNSNQHQAAQQSTAARKRASRSIKHSDSNINN